MLCTTCGQTLTDGAVICGNCQRHYGIPIAQAGAPGQGSHDNSPAALAWSIVYPTLDRHEAHHTWRAFYQGFLAGAQSAKNNRG